MALEILDAQSGSTTGTSLVTTADVHPVPELDLGVKLEQEEGRRVVVMMMWRKCRWSQQLQPSSSSPNPKLNLLIFLDSAHCGKVKINTHFIPYALSVADLFCN